MFASVLVLLQKNSLKCNHAWTYTNLFPNLILRTNCFMKVLKTVGIYARLRMECRWMVEGLGCAAVYISASAHLIRFIYKYIVWRESSKRDKSPIFVFRLSPKQGSNAKEISKIMQFLSMKMYSSSSSPSNILFAISVYLVLCTTKAVIKLPNNETVPALIVFGDSIVDPGNNNNLKTLAKCNFPPYGRDFMGGIPTGRFCNGKIPTDLIAAELGIKELLPAYLDPTLQPNDLLTGVCFASGGSGYDPLTSVIESALSLSDQLELFKEYVGKLKVIAGDEKTNFILAKSIFLVIEGSNDIANSYFLSGARKLQYDIPSYTDFMVNSASSFMKELYELGARRICVFSAPPLGCLPSIRTLAGGLQRECVEEYNQAAQLYNTKLSSEMDFLTNNLPHARVVYVDIYNPLFDIIQNPEKYGFEVVDKGCCGTGAIEVTLLCNQLNPFTCTNVSNYVFWDSYHPTERAYSTIIPPLLQKYIINSFFCGNSPC